MVPTPDVRVLIEKRGLTTLQVAKQCGMTRGTLNRYLAGSLPWSEEAVTLVAMVLGAPEILAAYLRGRPAYKAWRRLKAG